MHAENATTTTTTTDALDYWGVESIDQPIAIVPFPCGRFVCPNHQTDQATSEEG